MNWNKHSDVAEQHAFLGASNYHWLNYDLDKLTDVYKNELAKTRGTELHAFASMAIKLQQRLRASKKALNQFVNDAITYKMESEQVLFYSYNCFGTADAISFRNNLLRISDLKTGVTKPSMNQLKIYAALFCLEYNVRPEDIIIELRIYQNSDVALLVPEATEIIGIMDIIVSFDDHINKLKMEA